MPRYALYYAPPDDSLLWTAGVRWLGRDPETGETVAPPTVHGLPPARQSQLTEAARSEMVVTLEDAVVRRTPLGALGCPTDAALKHAATIVGDVLGWDEEKRGREITSVRRFYDSPDP